MTTFGGLGLNNALENATKLANAIIYAAKDSKKEVLAMCVKAFKRVGSNEFSV